MSRRLNNWLEEYVKHTSHSEAPEKFHFWTGVSTLAGALRRKVWIDMGYFQWTPNFYIFFIAPPGIVNKSTTGSLGMDLLKELGYIHFGPSAGTWQALIERMTDLREDFLLPTGEYMPMTAVTLVVSELGTFIDPTDRLQIDVLVDLWDGKQGTWSKSTKKDGAEEIVNPWVNMLGFTTPSWIAENLNDYFAGGGFMSRSIFVYAEKKRQYIAYPKKSFPTDFYRQREDLIHDLAEISALCGEITLSAEAIAWGEKWYIDHYESDHPHIAGEMFGGYLARKQTHIHKLAMILAVSEGDRLIIEPHHLQLANQEVTKLEKEMPKIFGKMNQEKTVLIARDVLRAIIASGEKGISQTLLYREFAQIITFETFEIVLRSLRHSDYISEQSRGGKMFLLPKNVKK